MIIISSFVVEFVVSVIYHGAIHHILMMSRVSVIHRYSGIHHIHYNGAAHHFLMSSVSVIHAWCHPSHADYGMRWELTALHMIISHDMG